MLNAFELAVKDLRLLMRDRVALFWVLGFPLIFALFFGAVVQAQVSKQYSPLTVQIVDEVDSAFSQRLVSTLLGDERLKADTSDLNAAERAVQRADAIGFVHITKPRTAETEGTGGGIRRLPASVQLGVDPSHAAEAELLRAIILSAFEQAGVPQAGVQQVGVQQVGVQQSRTGARQQAGAGSNAAEPPAAQKSDCGRLLSGGTGLKLQTVDIAALATRPREPSEYVFPSAVLWGLMGCAACFAVSLVTERTRGTLLRLRAAPIGYTAILGGKALACFSACLLDALLLSGVGAIAFGVQFDSVAKLLLAVISAALAFVGITMALSTLGRTEQAVAGAGWATLLVMAMLGGAMVPLAFMPEWLVELSQVSPVRWGMLALEGATWRQFGWAKLLQSCSVLASIGGVGFLMGLGLLRREVP